MQIIALGINNVNKRVNDPLPKVVRGGDLRYRHHNTYIRGEKYFHFC